MSTPQLILPDYFDDRIEMEMNMKGYLSGASVQIGSKNFSMYFIDTVRLAQDIESYMASGETILAEPGLVVLHEVTLAEINIAIDELHRQGYFDRVVEAIIG